LKFEKIKGIIFDLDGTVIHSEIDFYKMKSRMIKIFECNGIESGLLKLTETTVAILKKANEKLLEQEKTPDEIERIESELEEVMNQVEHEALPFIKPIESAAEAIKKIKKMGFKLAILTRSNQKYAIEALKKISAYEYFDVILGRENTDKPKPDMESILQASQKLGLTLNDVIIVGDNHIDASCAANAKCPFIGVRTGPRGEDSWQHPKPKNLLNSIKELPEFLQTNLMLQE
jgi:HAD superfamily hydrolase (TIGR01549 family)